MLCTLQINDWKRSLNRAHRPHSEYTAICFVHYNYTTSKANRIIELLELMLESI